jgi:large subunit ribosomal protein L2
VGIKKFKPVTSSTRYKSVLTFEELTTATPEKSLTKFLPSKGGRASNGRISVRRRGGRHRRLYRMIDFKRDKVGIEGKIATVEYDPNRSTFICLVFYKDGEKRYILAPKGITVGTKILSGPSAPIEAGNALPLEFIPLGLNIHNIELRLGRGGQLVRGAGTSAVIVAKEGDYATVRLPSGEMRMIFKKCFATIGELSNEDNMNISLGKAGRSRWLGKRPKTRGVAMNPHDHPHGGGEGKTSGGRHPVTPWGKPTKGYKTRKKRKTSSNFIVKRRR